MYRTLIRLLAVCLLALSPVWGVGEVAARPAGYPVWPSFLSTGCNSVSSGAGGTTTVCGQGGFLLTQVNSGYACNRLDIGISAFSSGPFIVTGTADSGSVENTITVNDTGDYTMDFPGFLVNNLIVIQMSAPDSGSMTVAYIQTIPCPVQPTATNTLTPSNTPTPNPSDTATNTATPGPSHTPTAIPTYTPLPSGHSTFTPTASNTPINTATPTATAVPMAGNNCGTTDFPVFNCNVVNSVATGGTPLGQGQAIAPDWQGDRADGTGNIKYATQCNVWAPCAGQDANYVFVQSVGGSGNVAIDQITHAYISGTVHVIWANNVAVGSTGSTYIGIYDLNQSTESAGNCSNDASCGFVTKSTVGSSSDQSIYHITVGHDYAFFYEAATQVFSVTSVYVVPDSGVTPFPGTATGTPTPLTPTPIGPTSTPTLTPIPIPGAPETLIPTDTPCPGGCAVKQLTQVPGFATRVLVDTSPFSALEHLSLARSSCQPFGYVQIPVPVIHGTPALGSTEPLSFTWTAPVTHTWDDTNVFSNTALQPCAMVNEIPSFVWDLTYWLSVLMCAVGWFMWLIGFVGRLSGDETING